MTRIYKCLHRFYKYTSILHIYRWVVPIQYKFTWLTEIPINLKLRTISLNPNTYTNWLMGQSVCYRIFPEMWNSMILIQTTEFRVLENTLLSCHGNLKTYNCNDSDSLYFISFILFCTLTGDLCWFGLK